MGSRERERAKMKAGLMEERVKQWEKKTTVVWCNVYNERMCICIIYVDWMPRTCLIWTYSEKLTIIPFESTFALPQYVSLPSQNIHRTGNVLTDFVLKCLGNPHSTLRYENCSLFLYMNQRKRN